MKFRIWKDKSQTWTLTWPNGRSYDRAKSFKLICKRFKRERRIYLRRLHESRTLNITQVIDAEDSVNHDLRRVPVPPESLPEKGSGGEERRGVKAEPSSYKSKSGA